MRLAAETESPKVEWQYSGERACSLGVVELFYVAMAVSAAPLTCPVAPAWGLVLLRELGALLSRLAWRSA